MKKHSMIGISLDDYYQMKVNIRLWNIFLSIRGFN